MLRLNVKTNDKEKDAAACHHEDSSLDPVVYSFVREYPSDGGLQKGATRAEIVADVNAVLVAAGRTEQFEG